MTISVRDGSDYFRGLLLLLRKDRQIAQSEVALMRRIGASLGFEREFCENAIGEILENAYVQDAAPVFSVPALAEMFLRDGLTIASSDGEIHTSELTWLEQVAAINGLPAEWIGRERGRVQSAEKHGPTALEADGLKVLFS